MSDTRQVIVTAAAPAAIGPYSQAISVAGSQRLIFCSGQIALDPATGQMVGAGEVRAQTRQVLANLGAVLAAAGSSFAQVVRTTIFLADMADFGAVNELYAAVFKDAPPARATVQAAGLPKGAMVEIDAIAIA
jgi:2-iminobutanoate/2-iminopropanoate deaminase